MSTAYQEFLARRAQWADGDGFEPGDLPGFLFGFQVDLVRWALRRGRGALFADCGLGKTPMELVWADRVRKETGRPVLLVTPLAVGFQIVAEAERFGVEAAISRDGTITAPVTVTNYERMERFDPGMFGGVVCDESSAIKAFDGQRRAVVTEFLRRMRFRLLGTATAAPNDYVELGTSSEALGVLGHIDMLNRFFINNNRTSDTKGKWRGRSAPRIHEGPGWRFKGHAQEPFWRWVSSWARAVRRPSDLGYEDGRFVLPPLLTQVTVVHPEQSPSGMLFDLPSVGLAEERDELRRTLRERCETAADLADGDDPVVVWCHLNDESKLIARLIPGAVEVSGSDTPEAKESKLRAFTDGDARVLVTKPKIGAWGLNWQHCHRVVYFPSHSYEQYYQAVRRCWRFGQASPVTVDVVTTPGGRNTLANLQRKSEQANVMFEALLMHMNAAAVVAADPFDTPLEVPAWLSPTS